MSNIEKIRQEIERRRDICKGIFERDSDIYYQGKAVAYDESISIIDSLPEEDLYAEVGDTEEDYIKRSMAKVNECRKMICKDSLQVYETCKENQDSFTSLEEAAARYERDNRESILSSVDIVDAFLAGAELQAKHSPLPEDSVAFNNGIKEGKRLMMEEAVEGEIGYWNQRGLSIRLDKSLERLGYDMDTKVKIIIIKGND